MNHARRFAHALLIFALAVSALPAYGRGGRSGRREQGGKSPAPAPPSKTINVNFKDLRLKNGMRLLLVEDHSAPVVSVAITFDVGSRNERKGRTGFAHLFEHMMFTGSENVGRNEYSLLVETNGGDNNATTSE